MRKIIASRLLESKTQIPHIYVSADADLDALLSLRKELKSEDVSKFTNIMICLQSLYTDTAFHTYWQIALSVNDFVIKAAALALRSVPEANSYWDPKLEDVIFNNSVDIAVAVATPKGLLTPIIKVCALAVHRLWT